MEFIKTKISWKDNGSMRNSATCWLLPLFIYANSIEEIENMVDEFEKHCSSNCHVLSLMKVKNKKYEIRLSDGTPHYLLIFKDDELYDYIDSQLHGMENDSIVCSKTGIYIDFNHTKKVDHI